MLKRAHLYFRTPCPGADEAKKFLEDHGVIVLERDIVKRPLTRRELGEVLGYHDPKYYLDGMSSAFRKNKLDKLIPPHEELLGLILEHPDLLRHPIVMSGRLMTVGNNRQKLAQMFQIRISDNGSGEGRRAPTVDNK